MCVLQITLLLNNRTERFPPAQCFCLLFAQSSLRGKTKISHKGSLFTPLKSRKVSGLKLYWLWGGQLNRKIPECSIKREKNCLRNYCQNDMFWCSGWKDCVQRAVKPFICAKPKECCEDKQRIYPLLVSPSKGRETNTYLFSVLFLFFVFFPRRTKMRDLDDVTWHQTLREGRYVTLLVIGQHVQSLPRSASFVTVHFSGVPWPCAFAFPVSKWNLHFFR